jgi:hypothetical protein
MMAEWSRTFNSGLNRENRSSYWCRGPLISDDFLTTTAFGNSAALRGESAAKNVCLFSFLCLKGNVSLHHSFALQRETLFLFIENKWLRSNCGLERQLR